MSMSLSIAANTRYNQKMIDTNFVSPLFLASVTEIKNQKTRLVFLLLSV